MRVGGTILLPSLDSDPQTAHYHNPKALGTRDDIEIDEYDCWGRFSENERAAVRTIILLSLQSDGSSHMIQRHQVPVMSSRINESSSSAGRCHRILHESGSHGLGIDQHATELNVMSIDLALCVPTMVSRMNGSNSSAGNCHRTSHESRGQCGTELNVRHVRLIDLAFQTVFTAWEHDHMTYSMYSGIAKAKFNIPPSILDYNTIHQLISVAAQFNLFFDDLVTARNSSGFPIR